MFLSLAFGCQLIAATFENQQVIFFKSNLFGSIILFEIFIFQLKKLADLIKFVQSADPTNLSNELRDVHEFLKAE